MIVLVIGGQWGYAIGPPIATGILHLLCLRGSLLLFIVPASANGHVIVSLPGLRPPGDGRRGSGLRRHATSERREAWVPFVCLSGALLARSVIFYGLNALLDRCASPVGGGGKQGFDSSHGIEQRGKPPGREDGRPSAAGNRKHHPRV